MPKFFCDLHLHSQYEMSASNRMDLLRIDEYAMRKGIKLMGTGDCMYPTHLADIEEQLHEVSPGIFERKQNSYGTKFMLTTEVNCSCIWNEHNRRTHILVLFKSVEDVREATKLFKMFGDVSKDPRPTFVLAPKFFVKYLKDTAPDCEIIPAHVLTPWYGLFGSRHGFDSVEEAFEEETENILALETGLSADPAMITQVTGDAFSLVSFGDAHSLHKIGRELTALDCDMTYDGIVKAIRNKEQLYTVEFYPQMGKYYLSGHRDCKTSLYPEDAHGKRSCPTCGKRFVQGVAYRVWQLKKGKDLGLPVRYTIPLREIIAMAGSDNRTHHKSTNRRNDSGIKKTMSKIVSVYENAISKEHPEMNTLLGYGREKLITFLEKHIVDSIMQVRTKQLTITPGYDGLFGMAKFDAISMKEEMELLEESNPELPKQPPLFDMRSG